MRIVQLIDSLEAGGAERMAVQYANELSTQIEFSGLVATRKEGSLLQQVDPSVSYLFLNKKGKIDLKALYRLRSFVLNNRIMYIHAHSSSFFIAFLLKLIYPSVKVIWHYHYGNNLNLSKKKIIIFRMVMPFINGVIAVNRDLRLWIENDFKSNNVVYFPNFTTQPKLFEHTSQLQGELGKRIVSLANFREDKNHFLLLKVAKKLKKSNPDWTFHLVGKDFGDEYSFQIKNLIAEYKLENNVFLYGSKQDIENILNQATIAILTSQSEGLPLSLLEYGLNQKPVVVTNVGQISAVVTDEISGFLVPSGNIELFFNSLAALINDHLLRERLATNLFQKVEKEFSAGSVIQKYIQWVKATITDE